MKVALLGLPQSGKSTLFAAVSGKQAAPMGSTAIEEAIVSVPDERLDWLTAYCKPRKIVHGTIDCLDVPGLSFADEHGRTAARRLLSGLRTVDLIVLVVRAFKDVTVPAYRNRVDTAGDLSELRTELLLADLELIETRIERLEKQVNKPTQTQSRDRVELALQLKLREAIESERPVSTALETEAEKAMIKSLAFLTQKPFVVVVNMGEEGLEAGFEPCGKLGQDAPVIALCAKLEHELAQLDAGSRAEFMADLGIKESALAMFVNSCYRALGLISFLTIGPDEVRAWPITAGTIAHDAAGKVHTDIKRGFIRAETFAYTDLRQYGDEKALKAAGKIRLEGKEYVVRDGDIINFRFNV